MEINAVLIMQTLFGFELGNYYRSVIPLPLQTEFPRQGCPHHIDLIPPQSLRKRQNRLTSRDVLVLFAFIAGHGILLVLVVVFFLRERR